VVSFGPEGIYGHYDHIAVHRWTTIAYDLAADKDCFPDAISGTCTPHQVSKLYYQVLSEEAVRWMSQDGKPASVMMDGVPFAMNGYSWDGITTVVDIGDYVQVKLRGLQCHATQIDARADPDEVQQMMESRLFRQETFVLARSDVGWPDAVETDLFRGLRG
jgi:LmbE family N-acetylglucosaminyl deacetylase